MNLGLELQVAQLAGLADFIHDKFLAFSNNEIDLAVSAPTLLPNATPPAPVSALQLHTQLLQLNHNAPNLPINSICLLIAHSYSGLPGAFGIMFDRGYGTADDPNTAPIFLDRPRQGCAVFVGQIAQQRSADQVASEMFFTASHELGHVFNLQHDETCLNFMRVSDPNQSYAPVAYNFTPYQQSRLAACSSDPNVMPGSSVFESEGAYDLPITKAAPLSKSLRLDISVARTSFWRFEPIQIEVGLSLANSRTPPILVPAVLDPSQSRFRFMIENDRGERALYRSPYRVCSGNDMLTISTKQAYRRDFPIFGQSGGLTFKRAGRHVIWAELDLGDKRLRSNELTIEIRSEVGLAARDLEMRSILSAPDVSRLLFHREDVKGRRAIQKLARYIELVPNVPAAGEINYSIARAMLKAPRALASFESRERAKRLLDRALSSKDIGSVAQARAGHLLDGIRTQEPKARRHKLAWV
jgi:hypothetical protein